jgi:hypothetical protein
MGNLFAGLRQSRSQGFCLLQQRLEHSSATQCAAPDGPGRCTGALPFLALVPQATQGLAARISQWHRGMEVWPKRELGKRAHSGRKTVGSYAHPERIQALIVQDAVSHLGCTTKDAFRTSRLHRQPPRSPVWIDFHRNSETSLHPLRVPSPRARCPCFDWPSSAQFLGLSATSHSATSVTPLYAAFCPSTFRSACATAVEDAGFCPVIRWPSTIAKGCQLGTFSKMPPSRFSSSSTRNGTTLVNCTASSSPLVKPVTRLPSTIGAP